MHRLIWLFIIGGWWVSGWLVQFAVPERVKRTESLETLHLHEEKAAASLVGEFRSSLAGYLWQKTDEYVHGGVLLRPMSEREKAQGAHRATSGDNIQAHQEYATSVIPERKRDPRGFWGELEREIKPFFDVRGHKHRNVRETLPLFRFMTWVDPSFVPSYIVGAQVILFTDRGRVSEALALLREGLRYNPNSLPLHTEYARLLLVHRKAYSEAETHLLQAIQGVEETGDELEQESLQDAYRWLVLIYRKQGQKAKALSWARRGSALFPDDPVFLHTLAGKKTAGSEVVR